PDTLRRLCLSLAGRGAPRDLPPFPTRRSSDLGGAGNDSFDVQASQSGSLDGGNDADTVTLAPGVSIAGALTGGAGGNDDDTLAQGGAAANSWLVNGLDAGLVNAQLFTEFENLVGGAGADSFALVGTLTGTAAG